MNDELVRFICPQCGLVLELYVRPNEMIAAACLMGCTVKVSQPMFPQYSIADAMKMAPEHLQVSEGL